MGVVIILFFIKFLFSFSSNAVLVSRCIFSSILSFHSLVLLRFIFFFLGCSSLFHSLHSLFTVFVAQSFPLVLQLFFKCNFCVLSFLFSRLIRLVFFFSFLSCFPLFHSCSTVLVSHSLSVLWSSFQIYFHFFVFMCFSSLFSSYSSGIILVLSFSFLSSVFSSPTIRILHSFPVFLSSSQSVSCVGVSLPFYHFIRLVPFFFFLSLFSPLSVLL